MKTDTNHNNQLNLIRERCSAYLLGELNDQQTAAFEAQLDDPYLSESLLRESDLICGIATNQSLESVPDGQPVPSPAPHASPRNRSFAVLLSALAATILFAFVYSLPKSREANAFALTIETKTPSVSFELELAKTWVQPAIDWSSDDQERFNDLSAEEPLKSFDEADSDETFEWMVAAVEASIREGERNDG